MSEGTTPPSDRSGDDDTVAFGPDGAAPAAGDDTVALTPGVGLPPPAAPAPPPPGPAPGERPTEAGAGFDGAASGGPVSDQRPTPWRTRPAGATPPPTVRAQTSPGPGGPGGPSGPGGPTPPPTPPPARGGGSSNALTFVAVGGVIVLVVVIVVMALTLGFGGDDDGDGDEVATSDTTTSTSTTSTTASTTTSTTTSTTVATTPSTTASTVPPPAVTIIVDGRDLAPGLFCRDLQAEGATFDEALAYWLQEGRPARMDDDGNGIPCETVYPPADVEAVYGSRDVVDEGVPAGLFCRDLPPLGLDYSAAYAYWETEGRPARMDDDGNGVPCESVYPADEVQAFLG